MIIGDAMVRLRKGERPTLFRQVCFGSALLFLAIYSLVCLPLSVHSATLSNFTVDNASLVREKLKPNADKFTLKGAFQLTADANDANPTQEQVVFSLGPFSQTIPANTFTQKDGPKKSTWKFKGAKGGLTSVVIAKTSDAWTVTAIASELSFGDVIETNPVRLSLQIGDESGAVDLYFLKKSSTKRTLFKFPSGEKDDADGDGKTEKEGDCDDSDPMVYTGASELCDGVDNDCDKKVDEDFDKGATCTVGAGACVRTGVKVCAPDGTETVCNVTPGTTSLELCGNGLDDDCDGEVDEGFNLGAPCTVGIGACQRSGVLICSQDRGSAVCDSTPGMPTTEVCNSIDDNCNGQTDEGLGTISCGQGGCEHTVAACVNGQPEVCTPGTPKAEICGNGIDEDCNGSDLTCVVTLDIAITGPANLSSTNRSMMAVNGTADPKATKVTCNGKPAEINKSSNTFGGNVPLKEGQNIVTCVAENDTGDVGSASISVTLDSTSPRIAIDSPQDNAVVISTPITVTGMVNDLVMGTVNGDEAGVTCKGVQAQVANRRFVVANVPLDPGTNTVTCIGEDKVGNIDSAHITVTLDTTAQAKIRIVSGNNQTAGIGALLPEPLVVALTENGAPVVGKVVVFKVLQNDGVLSTNTDNGRILGAPTDTNGRASMQFKLGSWAGAGNNQVEVTASGFVGGARFNASALPAAPNSIVVDAGNMQFGAVSQLLPKPFIATVIDRGSNRLGGVPVTFRVVQGGGNFDRQPEKTVTTDSDGRAQAVLTLGPDEGFDNNLVEANFTGSAGFAATFTASGKTPGKPEDTRISGVVLDNSNNPIQGVTLHVEGTSLTTQSDEQGQFLLQPAPVGHVKLLADGSTAPLRNGLPWPKLEYELVTIAGQDNAIGMPIYLLPIDTPRGLLVDETHGGTLTLDELPGFALTIVPGSATFPDNTKRGTVSVTLVHADKVPMVPNFGQQPRFIITIQPAGTHFNPPAPLTMPNVDGFAPGQKTEMYSFDHDLGSFVSIGPATVSEDGTVIKSDPGVGVVKGGWHCGGNPSQSGSSGNLNLSVSPQTVTVKVGDTFTLTAQGSPPRDGIYAWVVLLTSQVFDGPPIISPDPPSCRNSPSCTATYKAKEPGQTTIRVTFHCTTTGQQVQKDIPITVNPSPKVTILSADVTIDRIEIKLEPGNLPMGSHGPLTLELIGPNNNLIRTVDRSSGTYTETFDIDNLHEGEYRRVRATWTVNSVSVMGEYDYHIRVLGEYRHSQYNSPDERRCTGGSSAVFMLTSPQTCFDDFNEENLKSAFITQVNVNGSGISENFGDIKSLAATRCNGETQNRPPDATGGVNGNSFVQVQAIDGACLMSLDETSLASCRDDGRLACGNQIFIQTIGIKTIRDICPLCCSAQGMRQLDHYTRVDTRCTAGHDLTGSHMTIKLCQQGPC